LLGSRRLTPASLSDGLRAAKAGEAAAENAVRDATSARCSAVHILNKRLARPATSSRHGADRRRAAEPASRERLEQIAEKLDRLKA
jgi:hypothetical protein